MGQMPQTQRRLPQQLIGLYDFVSVVALVEGMLRFPQRLVDTLGFVEDGPSATVPEGATQKLCAVSH